MEKLSRSASGLRHLRWAREVLATLSAHYEHNAHLGMPAREAVLAEMVELRASIDSLSAAVKAYRDFLERRRVGFRGMQRVGLYLCEEARKGAEKALAPLGAEGVLSIDRTRRSSGPPEAPGAVVELSKDTAASLGNLVGALPALSDHVESLSEAALVLEGFNEAYEKMEARERLPLKAALSGAIERLRKDLSAMDTRLERAISAAFVDSLYPMLARDRTVVADHEDGDDDASAEG